MDVNKNAKMSAKDEGMRLWLIAHYPRLEDAIAAGYGDEWRRLCDLENRKVIEYANTSQYYGGGWTPEITGYDADDNEYRFEVDLHEGARYNWNKFKEKFPGAKYPNKFYHELWYVRENTEKENRRAR